MKLQLEWARAMPLRDARRDENLIYTVDWAKLPETCGVYVFGRRFGRNFEALYVGQATNGIGARVRQQLKNLPLMLHLKGKKRQADYPRSALRLPTRPAGDEMPGALGARADPILSFRRA